MIGHWEGEMTSLSERTPVLLDGFEDKILLSLPAFGIYAINGIYRYYRDNGVSIYFSQEHPITINLFFDHSRNQIKGIVSQDENTFELCCDKVFMRPINCIGNNRSEYYLNILEMTTLTLEEYCKTTSRISYNEIPDITKRKILDFYNFASFQYGTLDEVLAMMGTIHNMFKHTSSFAPEYKINTLSVIRHNPKQINCRAFAILFNELALAAGYKSRYVTCLPYKDWENECHVINEIFVDRLDKWVIIDANIGTVIKDARGNYLNLYEYRQTFFSREKCQVLESASYNGEKITIDDYNSYMVKNMYKFQYKAVYGFDTEDEQTLRTKIDIRDK